MEIERNLKDGVLQVDKDNFEPIKSVKLFKVDELKTPNVKFDGERFTEQV